MTFRKFLQRWMSIAPATLFYIVLILLVYLVISLFIDLSLNLLIVLEIAVILFSIFVPLMGEAETSSWFEYRIVGDSFKGLGNKARTFRRGCSQMRYGDVSDALESFNELKTAKLVGRERAVLCFYLGRCYDVMGYPTNAANYYRESLDADIDIDEVYLITARAFTVGGNYDEAEEIYEALLSRETKLENIYTDLGMVYIKANKPDKALETFSKSAKLHHNYSFALGGLALAYLLKSDTVNARFFFSQAIINNIDDTDGFTEYYCSVAESKGLGDEIGVSPHPKLYFDPALLKGGKEL